MGTHTHKFQASVLRLVSCVHKLEGKIFSLESVSAVLKTTTENMAIWNWTKSILNPVSFLPTISPEVPSISSMPLNCVQFHREKMPQPDKRKAISTNCCLIALEHRQFFKMSPVNGHSSLGRVLHPVSGIFPRFSVNVLRICGSCWAPCGGWPVLANCCSLDLQLAEPGALCITQGITDRKTACPDSAVTFKTKHKVSNQFLSCASSHGRPRFHFRVTCALVIAGLEYQQNRELLSVKTKLPRVASRLPGVKAVNMRCRTSRCYQPCSYLCCVMYDPTTLPLLPDIYALRSSHTRRRQWRRPARQHIC